MHYNRILWGSRRGMLELDLILLPFVQERYQSLPEQEQVMFQQLLECEDQDMFAWLLHRVEPEDPAIAHIVQLVRQHALTRTPT